jgi:hypothetical protein
MMHMALVLYRTADLITRACGFIELLLFNYSMISMKFVCRQKPTMPGVKNSQEHHSCIFPSVSTIKKQVKMLLGFLGKIFTRWFRKSVE